MKSRHLIAIAIAVATLGMSNASFADGPMQRAIRAQNNAIQDADDRRNDRAERRDDRRDDRADRRDHRREHRADRRDDRRDYRRDWRQDRWEDRRDWRADQRYYRPTPQVRYHYHARGPEFRRGGYVPYEYRNRQYVVADYYQYNLAAPPRGHHWVQVGGDYVLIAIATGLIANIILNN